MNECPAHCICSILAVSLPSPSLPQVNGRIKSIWQNFLKDVLCAWPCSRHWSHRVDTTYRAHSPVWETDGQRDIRGTRWAMLRRIHSGRGQVPANHHCAQHFEESFFHWMFIIAPTPPYSRRCLRRPPLPYVPFFFARQQCAHPEISANDDCSSPLPRHLSFQLPLQFEEAKWQSWPMRWQRKSSREVSGKIFCFLIKERDAQGAFPGGGLSFPLVLGVWGHMQQPTWGPEVTSPRIKHHHAEGKKTSLWGNITELCTMVRSTCKTSFHVT